MLSLHSPSAVLLSVVGLALLPWATTASLDVPSDAQLVPRAAIDRTGLGSILLSPSCTTVCNESEAAQLRCEIGPHFNTLPCFCDDMTMGLLETCAQCTSNQTPGTTLIDQYNSRAAACFIGGITPITDIPIPGTAFLTSTTTSPSSSPSSKPTPEPTIPTPAPTPVPAPVSPSLAPLPSPVLSTVTVTASSTPPPFVVIHTATAATSTGTSTFVVVVTASGSSSSSSAAAKPTVLSSGAGMIVQGCGGLIFAAVVGLLQI